MRSLYRTATLLGTAAALALGGCHRVPQAPDGLKQTEAAIMGFAKSGAEWPARGGDYTERGFSPLTQIDTGNVGKLGLAWVADVDSDRGLEATPIMVDGVLYISSTWSRVMAFDAKTGKRLWAYDPGVFHGLGAQICCDIVNRGVAVWNGKVYVGTLDGRLVALDAKTGKPAWSVDTIVNRSRPYTITGAPRVVKGKVIIGNSGADLGSRGYVSAYDAQTGKFDWRFWIVPEGPNDKPENAAVAAALKTWPKSDVWKGIGGGNAWDSMAYDPELNLVYVGTGNGGPWQTAHPENRTDNLYVSSIVALNADTGELAWYYQETPGESWDYTATNSIILGDMTIDGKPRKVLFQAPKNGFFYVLDRKTGQLISAEKYGAVTWADHVDLKTGKPVLNPNTDFSKKDQMIWPNPQGAHDWPPMSFNPQTGLAYIPAYDVPWIYSTNPNYFRYFYDIGVPKDELARMAKGQPTFRQGGFLRAWDVANHKLKWEVPLNTTWNSGTLTTAGNLVFQASGDGYFSGYDAANGKRLVHLFTGNSAMAQPMTYYIDGTQYIAQLAGYGGGGMLSIGDDAAVKQYENTGRLIVYKLNGGAIPTPAKRDKPIGPPVVDNSGLPPLSAAQIARGAELFNNCSGCHSTSGGTPMLPNLGRVREIGKDGLHQILLHGALQPYGMPSFAGKLSDKDVDTLYEYISRGYHNQPRPGVYWP